MEQTESIPQPVLARPVQGRNLSPGRLTDQLERHRTLMVFLRHLN